MSIFLFKTNIMIRHKISRVRNLILRKMKDLKKPIRILLYKHVYHRYQQNTNKCRSLPVQRQKVNYFIYWKGKKPSEETLTIFFAQLTPKTGNARQGR